ncbi:iron-containing alcohol dehydrogenase [Agathobaculum sp. NTUH-O15-33]|uniref:iron-containing alcohol dehydrogenase n=1 Tax=Agathobaculum sp. NTUH-O15-33 TaxID=3079302 RepID=UPI002958CD71|nr:iron-containing alcohol dehydrogenase [Agathobaculum sp. NTUH-O15-33]WNX86404.1 iron-containing alcohol dehydrogenase [Agathobaculum sp. NTUH-O15-33]
MDNFTFYSPTYFVFGRDSEEQTGACVKRYGGSKVLIHYGGGSVVRSGLLDRVKKSLDAEGISYIELGGAKPNPLSGLVYEGIELARKEKIDFVLAVGGGSAIDSAKAIAFGSLYDGDFWDFYCGKQGQVTKSLPIGVVLTLAATGSEGSTDSVITNEDGMHKRCADGDVLRPMFAIMNPELTTTLPPYQTASGISDIMSHSMERYFSHTRDVELTDRLLEAVMLTIVKEAKRVMADPSNYEARANIMWAAMIAHNNITGVGREQDWGTHHMENELSTTYGCSHGAGLAILTPYWMNYAMKHEGVDRFVQFATRVFGCQMNFEDPETTALEGIAAFQNFVKSIGMPTTIGEIGGKPEDAPKLAAGMFHEAPNHGHFVKLTPEIAEEIYRSAM